MEQEELEKQGQIGVEDIVSQQTLHVSCPHVYLSVQLWASLSLYQFASEIFPTPSFWSLDLSGFLNFLLKSFPWTFKICSQSFTVLCSGDQLKDCCGLHTFVHSAHNVLFVGLWPVIQQTENLQDWVVLTMRPPWSNKLYWHFMAQLEVQCNLTSFRLTGKPFPPSCIEEGDFNHTFCQLYSTSSNLEIRYIDKTFSCPHLYSTFVR